MKKHIATLFFAIALCFGLAVSASAAESDQNLLPDILHHLLELAGSASAAKSDSAATGSASATEGGFVIENGVLTAYYGSGGDVVIPNTVTHIDYEVFSGNTKLTSVTIPSSVKTIAGTEYAVSGWLKSWGTPTAVYCERADKGVFEGCTNLKSVTIENGLTEIPEFAFADCTALTSITFPSSVESIGVGAFYNSGLTSVTIPSTVKTMVEPRTFSAYYNDKYGWFDTLTDDTGAFQDCTHLENVVIEDGGLTTLSENMFSGCTGLTSIDFPPSVTTIGGGAFGRTGLKSVVVPNTVQTLGSYVFGNCVELTSAWISDSVTEMNSTFYKCTKLTNVKLPKSVTNITGVFSECTFLQQVALPNTITNITMTFDNCSALTSIVLPTSLEEVGMYAFMGCDSLTSVTIPNGSLQRVAGWAFRDCTALTSVSIPISVTMLSRDAFDDCTALKDIYYEGTQAQWEETVTFRELNHPTATVHYNSTMPVAPLIAYASTQNVLVDGKNVEFQCYALKDIYGNDTNYIKLRDIAYILNGTAAQFNVGWDGNVNIETSKAYTPNGSEMSTPFSGNRAYKAATSLTNIDGRGNYLNSIVLTDDSGSGFTYYKLRDLGNALDFNVGWSAEKGIYIESTPDTISRDFQIRDGVLVKYFGNGGAVTIPDSVTTIGDEAFYGKFNVTSITLPNTVTSIGNLAFFDCTGLTSINIPDSVTSIGGSAFLSCTALTSINIPNSVTRLGSSENGGFILAGCTSLTSVTLPNSITSIPFNMFSGCSSLTTVNIPDSVTKIEDDAFMNCTALTSIPLPSSLTEIESGVFWGCTALTSITIPSSVTTIDVWAFRECTALTSIVIPNSVTTIGTATFYKCYALTSVTIPASVTKIDWIAFNECNSLKDVYYAGSAEQWSQIDIEYEHCWIWNTYFPDSNKRLQNVNIHYNSPMGN